MIGLLQSGTGTGNGIWRPSCVSGLLAAPFADALRACARARAFVEAGACAPVGEGVTAWPPDAPAAAPGAAARRRLAAAVAARRRAAGEAAWPAVAAPVRFAAPPDVPVAAALVALVAVSRALVPVDAPAPVPAPAPLPLEEEPAPPEEGVLGVLATGVLTVGTDGVVTVTGGSDGVVTGAVGVFTAGTSHGRDAGHFDARRRRGFDSGDRAGAER